MLGRGPKSARTRSESANLTLDGAYFVVYPRQCSLRLQSRPHAVRSPKSQSQSREASALPWEIWLGPNAQERERARQVPGPDGHASLPLPNTAVARPHSRLHTFTRSSPVV